MRIRRAIIGAVGAAVVGATWLALSAANLAVIASGHLPFVYMHA